eukprot:COSAG06_NODE_3695_length_4999_cov_8.221837_2_plen_63_part_00
MRNAPFLKCIVFHKRMIYQENAKKQNSPPKNGVSHNRLSGLDVRNVRRFAVLCNARSALGGG